MNPVACFVECSCSSMSRFRFPPSDLTQHLYFARGTVFVAQMRAGGLTCGYALLPGVNLADRFHNPFY